MSYKLKQKKIPKNYFEDLEARELREKYKNKRIPFFEAEKVATRNFLSVGTLTHRVGHFVYYKDDLVRIEKVSKNGIYIQKYKRDKDDFMTPSGKPVFIKQSKVEKNVYPATYPQISSGVISPYNMATMPEV